MNVIEDIQARISALEAKQSGAIIMDDLLFTIGTKNYQLVPDPAATGDPAVTVGGVVYRVQEILAPVDCVLSAKILGTPGPWSTCIAGSQTRSVPWTKTVVTNASNGGVACGPLTGVDTQSQACAVSAGWWSTVPTNTWTPIPGTTYTDSPRPAGVLGRWGGIQEFGGFASDRLNSRFLWAACGGGAGAWSGNEIGEFNLKTPGVNMLAAPDPASSLWPPTVPPLPSAAHALNQLGRPNSSHASRSLVYSPRSKSLFKFSSGQTWEQDSGNFGNVFEALVEGTMGWEPANKHPDIPLWNQETLAWRAVDWRNGDMFVARNDHVYKYDERTKLYTDFLVNPMQRAIDNGSAAILESANLILVIGQAPVEDTANPKRLWEMNLTTGELVLATLSGPAASAITYSRANAIAGDPVGDCLWYFKDDQHLYQLKRTGPGTWTATDFPILGTPPALYGSGVRNGNEGVGPGIYNGFDFFPTLGGLAWIQRTDRPAWFVRLY